jgi:hypothetical protein
MTPARLAALTALLNLNEPDICRITGYSRGAVRNWSAGRARVWPPFAAWLESVAPQVQRVMAKHPPPNRNRPEVAPASAEVVAEALRNLPPPLREPREVRRAAIAAERAARQVAEAPAAPVESTPALGPPVYCSRCGRTFRTARCACEAVA